LLKSCTLLSINAPTKPKAEQSYDAEAHPSSIQKSEAISSKIENFWDTTKSFGFCVQKIPLEFLRTRNPDFLVLLGQ